MELRLLWHHSLHAHVPAGWDANFVYLTIVVDSMARGPQDIGITRQYNRQKVHATYSKAWNGYPLVSGGSSTPISLDDIRKVFMQELCSDPLILSPPVLDLPTSA